jgi:hypothetical protein
MKSNFVPQSSWEFNTLGIYNFSQPGPYQYIFDFLLKNQTTLGGDILEAGTYRGKTALSLGIFLRQNQLPGIVHGFDTFSGFPKYSLNDMPQKFEELFELDQISSEHFLRIQRLRRIKTDLYKQDFHPGTTSSSGDFSNNSVEPLLEKMDFLGLDNIQLHIGTFESTMKHKDAEQLHFSVIFMDCDLYDGYMETLNYGWDKLMPGGIIFLDEYYSLKFPGARIAVNEFFADKENFELIDVADRKIDDFERWIVRKLEKA